MTAMDGDAGEFTDRIVPRKVLEPEKEGTISKKDAIEAVEAVKRRRRIGFISPEDMDALEADREMNEVMSSLGWKDTNPKEACGIAKVPASVMSGPVLAEVSVAMLEGALKYGRHNYRVAGVRASTYYDACDRHIKDYWEGQDIDPDSGLRHVAKAIASLVVLLDAIQRDMLTDDRPPKSPDNWRLEYNAKVKELLEIYPNPLPACLEGDQYRDEDDK